MKAAQPPDHPAVFVLVYYYSIARVQQGNQHIRVLHCDLMNDRTLINAYRPRPGRPTGPTDILMVSKEIAATNAIRLNGTHQANYVGFTLRIDSVHGFAESTINNLRELYTRQFYTIFSSDVPECQALWRDQRVRTIGEEL